MLGGRVGDAVLELSGVLDMSELSDSFLEADLEFSEEALRELGNKLSAWKFGGKKKSLLAGRERFRGESLGEGVRLTILGNDVCWLEAEGDRRYELTESDLSFLVTGGLQATNSSSRLRLVLDFPWKIESRDDKKNIFLYFEIWMLHSVRDGRDEKIKTLLQQQWSLFPQWGSTGEGSLPARRGSEVKLNYFPLLYFSVIDEGLSVSFIVNIRTLHWQPFLSGSFCLL